MSRLGSLLSQFLGAQDREAQNRALLPSQFPGEVVALQRDRNTKLFVLHLDDENESEYRFDSDPLPLKRYLQSLGYRRCSEELIDFASEFGLAVMDLSNGRVVPVFPREPEQALKFEDGQSNGNRLATI